MATRRSVVRRVETLATTLWRLGAEFPIPAVNEFEPSGLSFSFAALLPGPPPPQAPEIRLGERWSRVERDRYLLVQYEYDFIERPLNRRRAFHRHDESWFLDRFAVTVHEHCEEVIGQAACSHYYGLPIDPFEAIRRFTLLWAQAELGCGDLQCMH